MNRSMQMVAVAAVAGMLTGGANALAADTPAAKDAAQPGKAQISVKAVNTKASLKLKALTLVGFLAKQEMRVAGKNRTGYVLITADGARVRLPAAVGNRGTAKPLIRLADYVSQNVKLTAMGMEQKKGDKVVVRVKLLKAIEKVAEKPTEKAA